MVMHVHIPLLSCCQRFGFYSLQFCSSIEKVFMESGVCPVKRWFLIVHRPLPALQKLQRSNLFLKLIFQFIKKTFIFSQMDDVSLSLNPQCLLEVFYFYFFQFFPIPTSWYFLSSLSCSGSFICTLEFFSHVNLYNGKYCSVWIERMEN